MIEPQIQYARTGDGVSIAYWTVGAGRAFVHLPLGVNCHIAHEPRIAGIAHWYEQVAQRYMLVRYDRRGFGSSTRQPEDMGTETLLVDLEAVIDMLKVEQVVLFGPVLDGAVACQYAAKHPEKVSHLILWNAAAGPRRSRPVSGWTKIAQEDWRTYTNAFMSQQWGWDRAQEAREYARLLRESIDADTYLQHIAAFDALDTRAVLPSVEAATLVVHHSELNKRDQLMAAAARELATAIPGAKLVYRAGTDVCPWLNSVEAEESAALIEAFVDGREASPEKIRAQAVPSQKRSAPAEQAGTAIILFADVVESTQITERVGDAVFRERNRALDRALRAIVVESGGTPIEGTLLGDGVLATFPAAAQGIAAALACASAGDEHGLPLHLGLHAGDVLREEGNVFGGAVIVASRISGLSAPGEILVSGTVRELARTSSGVGFEDRGERELKGVGEAVRVFAVRHGSM